MDNKSVTTTFDDTASTLAPRPSTSSSLTQFDKPEAPSGGQQDVYGESTGRAANPDAKPKEKSKVSKFLSKFQSPEVKKTQAMRDAERLEQERTGARKAQKSDVNRSSDNWAVGASGGFLPGSGA